MKWDKARQKEYMKKYYQEHKMGWNKPYTHEWYLKYKAVILKAKKKYNNKLKNLKNCDIISIDG